MSTEPAHTIVIGNEKGGSGKSTTAMHVIVGLLGRGYSVASIDVDIRQGTLSRYLANRQTFIKAAIKTGESNIEMPSHYTLKPRDGSGGDGEEDDAARVKLLIEGAIVNHDVVVIDTPGSASRLSVLAHSYADTLITPINDSFLDIDVLAQIDRRRHEVLAPSTYSQMVWEQNNRRVLAGRPPIDWVVMRNRLSHIEARNKREIAGLLIQLARRIGFRLAPGFGERVVFRELFLTGLTVLDLPEEAAPGLPPNPSHLAGRAEIRALLQTIGLSAPAPAAEQPAPIRRKMDGGEMGPYQRDSVSGP